MRSLILKVATLLIFPLLLLVAVFLLLRGHHEPGGGFIAGLVAACAVVLVLLAWDLETARRAIRFSPMSYVATGLVTAVGSGMIGWISARPFLSGRWVTLEGGPLPSLKLGTPLLFDMGVFLVVLGISLTIVFSMASTEE